MNRGIIVRGESRLATLVDDQLPGHQPGVKQDCVTDVWDPQLCQVLCYGVPRRVWLEKGVGQPEVSPGQFGVE